MATDDAKSMIWRRRGKRRAAVDSVGGHGQSPEANERAAALRASYVERAEYRDAAACTLQPFVLQSTAGPPPARGRALVVGRAPA